MYLKNQGLKSFFALIIVFCVLFSNSIFMAKGSDLPTFEELSLGNSVFIFRGSSKKPQFSSNSARYVKRSLTSRKLKRTRRTSKKKVTKRRKKSSTQKSVSKSKTASTKPKPVENDASAVESLFDKAVESYNKGRYEEAIMTYKQVVALDPAHPDAHANLASSYRQLERYADANAEYKFAAEYIKDDTDLFSEWGYCLGKVDEWTKAVARLQTAKELEADAINYANVGWGYLNAAQKSVSENNAAEARANFSQAKDFLQKAIGLYPQLVAAFLNLGVVYNGFGEPQKAVEILTKANSARANWLTATNELGVAYRQSNNLSAAIIQFQKAISIDEKFAVGYFNLGEAQYRSGRKDDARITLEKLKKLDKDLAARLEKIM